MASIRLLNFDQQISINIDEKIDVNHLFIAATYRQLVVASQCLITVYDLSSILLGESLISQYETITVPTPILALTSTMDRIIYVYRSPDNLELLKVAILYSNQEDQHLTMESFDANEKIHLCSLDDGTVFIGHNFKIFSLHDEQWSFESKIIKMCSGKEHLLVLLADGRIFTWGNGLHGALGLGDLEPCTQPTHIESLSNDVIDIAAGGWHSLVLLSDGSAMSWGWNNDGALGLDSSDRDDILGVFCDPTLVTCLPLDIDCRQISAGARHSAFVGSNGLVWLRGSNKHGQLGNSNLFSIEKKIHMDDDDDDRRPIQIRPLTGTLRHRLCGGQVCVSVASCVKELIENSLDAHSTRLQLTFIAHGADLIELVDNGDGIAEHDFESIGLRYHTSKISRFEDLEQVATYGFRGEALSSICIYADVTIVTRHASASIGTKLVFDGEGQLMSRTPCPREIGTTVSIRSLFNRFPVRRTELRTHSKREFSQALNVIQSFAIISRQIQFLQVLSSTDNHPPTNPLITITPSTSLKDSLAQIFGPKILESIIHFESNNDQNQEFQFKGFISRPQHGSGRTSTDRQYLYINNRPIDCAPLLRTMNETYRHYNPNQYPLIVLSIEVFDRSTLDVNCTPDKRTIFIQHLSDISDRIRDVLNKLFQASSNVYVVNNKRQPETMEKSDTLSPPVKQMRIERFAKKPSQSSDIPILTTNNPLSKFSGPFNMIHSDKSTSSSSSSSSNLSTQERALFTFESPSIVTSTQLSIGSKNKDIEQNASVEPEEKDDDSDEDDPQTVTLLRGSPSKKDFLDRIKQLRQKDETKEDETEIINATDHDLQSYKPTTSMKEKTKTVERSELEPYESIKVESYKSCEIKIKFDMTKLKEKYQNMTEDENVASGIPDHHFNVHIGEDQSEEAEDELRRQIDKSDFEKMTVIGQFNRGFILVKLFDHSSQLFIVDQHAADEIYNFHRLYEQTTISRQPLLHPKCIPLDPSRQVLLQQHLDIFTRLGFEIEIDENETRVDRRCRVLSYPTLSGANSFVFGISEIEDILAHLADASQQPNQEEQHYESARLRKVFASKACRMSIMIGTNLTRKQMINVVRHLGQLAKPWNCPHGRPTIRHVSNLTDATSSFLSDEYHSI